MYPKRILGISKAVNSAYKLYPKTVFHTPTIRYRANCPGGTCLASRARHGNLLSDMSAKLLCIDLHTRCSVHLTTLNSEPPRHPPARDVPPSVRDGSPGGPPLAGNA